MRLIVLGKLSVGEVTVEVREVGSGREVVVVSSQGDVFTTETKERCGGLEGGVGLETVVRGEVLL